MSEVFGDAALRHWQDASLLESNKRVCNADQLFAMATECAIKVALTAVSTRSDADSGASRSPIPAHRDHPFRSIAITDSGPSRSPSPGDG
jgi:hypothetical protein